MADSGFLTAIKGFLAPVWPINEWRQVKNAKILKCNCCEKYMVDLCQDQTSKEYYRVEKDEKLRKRLFILFFHSLILLPIFAIGDNLMFFFTKFAKSLSLIPSILFHRFSNEYTKRFKRAFTQCIESLLRLILLPIILMPLAITAFVGAILPFKDSPKNARKLCGYFEECLIRGYFFTYALRPVVHTDLSETQENIPHINELPTNRPYATFDDLNSMQALLKHLQPINDWKFTHIASYNCGNCGRKKDRIISDKYSDNYNGYYLDEPNGVLRSKLFFLSIGTLTINLYNYVAHSIYRLVKLITLYEFRNKENTWSDAFTTTAIDLARTASGPVLLPAMQVTAMLGVITPFADGPKDARKMYALGETLLYGYDEFRTANCFRPTYHRNVTEIVPEPKTTQTVTPNNKPT